jgi:ABC-type uncharacterized transport system fused permease/ATPase subunit
MTNSGNDAYDIEAEVASHIMGIVFFMFILLLWTLGAFYVITNGISVGADPIMLMASILASICAAISTITTPILAYELWQLYKSIRPLKLKCL